MTETYRTNSVTVLIVGKTGSGKSSLIEACQKYSPSKKSHRRTTHPITTCCVEYLVTTTNGKEIKIIDTPGFQDFDHEVIKKIAGKYQESRPNVVWFVIDSTLNRVGMGIREFCTEFLQAVPVFFVFTKSDAQHPDTIRELIKIAKSLKIPNLRECLFVSTEIRYPLPFPVYCRHFRASVKKTPRKLLEFMKSSHSALYDKKRGEIKCKTCGIENACRNPKCEKSSLVLYKKNRYHCSCGKKWNGSTGKGNLDLLMDTTLREGSSSFVRNNVEREEHYLRDLFGTQVPPQSKSRAVAISKTKESERKTKDAQAIHEYQKRKIFSAVVRWNSVVAKMEISRERNDEEYYVVVRNCESQMVLEQFRLLDLVSIEIKTKKSLFSIDDTEQLEILTTQQDSWKCCPQTSALRFIGALEDALKNVSELDFSMRVSNTMNENVYVFIPRSYDTVVQAESVEKLFERIGYSPRKLDPKWEKLKSELSMIDMASYVANYLLMKNTLAYRNRNNVCGVGGFFFEEFETILSKLQLKKTEHIGGNNDYAGPDIRIDGEAFQLKNCKNVIDFKEKHGPNAGGFKYTEYFDKRTGKLLKIEKKTHKLYRDVEIDGKMKREYFTDLKDVKMKKIKFKVPRGQKKDYVEKIMKEFPDMSEEEANDLVQEGLLSYGEMKNICTAFHPLSLAFDFGMCALMELPFFVIDVLGTLGMNFALAMLKAKWEGVDWKMAIRAGLDAINFRQCVTIALQKSAKSLKRVVKNTIIRQIPKIPFALNRYFGKKLKKVAEKGTEKTAKKIIGNTRVIGAISSVGSFVIDSSSISIRTVWFTGKKYFDFQNHKISKNQFVKDAGMRTVFAGKELVDCAISNVSMGVCLLIPIPIVSGIVSSLINVILGVVSFGTDIIVKATIKSLFNMLYADDADVIIPIVENEIQSRFDEQYIYLHVCEQKKIRDKIMNERNFVETLHQKTFGYPKDQVELKIREFVRSKLFLLVTEVLRTRTPLKLPTEEMIVKEMDAYHQDIASECMESTRNAKSKSQSKKLPKKYEWTTKSSRAIVDDRNMFVHGVNGALCLILFSQNGNPDKRVPVEMKSKFKKSPVIFIEDSTEVYTICGKDVYRFKVKENKSVNLHRTIPGKPIHRQYNLDCVWEKNVPGILGSKIIIDFDSRSFIIVAGKLYWFEKSRGKLLATIELQTRTKNVNAIRLNDNKIAVAYGGKVVEVMELDSRRWQTKPLITFKLENESKHSIMRLVFMKSEEKIILSVSGQIFILNVSEAEEKEIDGFVVINPTQTVNSVYNLKEQQRRVIERIRVSTNTIAMLKRNEKIVFLSCGIDVYEFSIAKNEMKKLEVFNKMDVVIWMQSLHKNEATMDQDENSLFVCILGRVACYDLRSRAVTWKINCRKMSDILNIIPRPRMHMPIVSVSQNVLVVGDRFRVLVYDKRSPTKEIKELNYHGRGFVEYMTVSRDENSCPLVLKS